MTNANVDENAFYVLLAGGLYKFPRTPVFDSVHELAMQMADLVTSGGTFIHEAPNGVVSIIKIPPGMPLQVFPGKIAADLVNEQRMAAFQNQQGGRRS